ncbi:MAG: DUF58 domain-containing protein [Clostridiales bacterium]|jgi:uncharacterized protein (DUF58 family)|nr:DUF58 domain-containing protein [Clostridiales bacterium]
MTVTKRFVICVAAGLVFIIISAIFLDVSTLAAVFLLYNMIWLVALLADYLMSRSSRKIILWRDKEDRLFYKSDNIVQIFARNEFDYPITLTLKDTLPGRHFRVVREDMTHRVEPGQETSFSYTVTPIKRGAFNLPTVYAYKISSLGLCQVYFKVDLPIEYKVYPNLRDLSKYRILTQNRRLRSEGSRVTKTRGLGSEFESLREYVVGDDIRKINWMATARENKLIVNQFQTERNQPVFCLIDCGRPMSYDIKGYKKLDYAINACLTLSDIVNTQGDLSGMLAFDTQVRAIIKPGKGDAHRNAIMQELYHLGDTRETSDYEGAFLEFLNKQKRHSLVFLFTDIETPEQARELTKYLLIIKKRHTPFVILMENESLQRLQNQQGDDLKTLYEKAAAREFLTSRRDLIRDMNRMGCFCAECAAENFTLTAINQYLKVKR